MKRTTSRGRAPVTLAAATLLAMATAVATDVGAASAQTTVTTESYTIGNGPVTSATAVAQPNTAGSTADYTVGFTTPSALAAGSGTITLSDPTGATVFPSSAADYFITDNSNPSAGMPVTQAQLGTGGHSVTLTVPSAVAAGQSLSLYVVGATNPSTAGSYSLEISTSGNPQVASTPTYPIAASASAPAFSPSSAPPLAGQAATYTIGTFKAASAVAPGGTIELESYAAGSTSDDVTFPATGTSYKVTDLTTNTSVQPENVTINSVGNGDNGESVLLQLPTGIAAGDELSVTVSGVKNPTTTQTDTVTAAAPSTASATTGSLQVGSSVSNPTISVSETGAGATGAGYIIGFKATSPIPAGGTVTLTAPPGTNFAGARVNLVDTTTSSASASIGVGSVHVSAANGSSSDNVLSFAVPTAVNAGDSLFVEADGVTNPAAGTYGGTAGNFTIATSGDVVPVSVPSYTVTATAAPQTASVEVSPNTPGALATYTIGDLEASANLASSSSTIELKGPAGTAFPSSPSFYTVVDLSTSSTSAHPTAITGGGTDDVVLTLGANIASGNFLDVQVGSVVNPPAGTYNMSVVGDLTAAVPPTSTTPPTTPPPVTTPGIGYWLLTRTGHVFSAGAAQTMGNLAVTKSTGAVVGIASTPDGKGYWVVTTNGTVAAYGDAKSYGDLPTDRVTASDIVAIAPTSNGQGYWLVGRDGGMFTFGNAKFHGSIPGLKLHVHNIVGMVASPDGAGYLIVGSDGGVFTFGTARFYGSLPGLHKHVNDVRAILPSTTGKGYVLVGSDGGAFVFGTGAHFLGSLPGRHIKVNNIVGIALTPSDQGYYMAGSGGTVYAFGNASNFPTPSGLSANLPVVAIAGT